MRATQTPHSDSSGSPASFLWPQPAAWLVAYANHQAENWGMSKSQSKALGRLIARERAKTKLTQRALAEKAGVTHPTILRLERAEFGRPDPKKLQRIAHALDLDVADFFALAGYVPSESLPSFGPYLRIRWAEELSEEDRRALERDFERRRRKRRRRIEKAKKGAPA
jgi:transcriptional regulator with XRE-family HTH domain